MSAALPLHLAPKPERITVEEYLIRERAAVERSEYLDGVTYAMAGESSNHGQITYNLVGMLYGLSSDKPCTGRTKDTKVRSGPAAPRPLRSRAGLFSYPDIVIICHEPIYFDDHTDAILNPTAIIEVLSPSTERFDRAEKFERYQRWNPSLIDYILVDQSRPRVEQFTRQPGAPWLYQAHDGLAATMTLTGVGCTLRLDKVYDRVTFLEPDDDADA